MTVDSSDPPAPLRLAMITMLMGLTMLVMTSDFTLVSVALPTIGRDFSVKPATLSWVVSGYSTVLAGFLIIGGRLTDAIGHRRCLILGILTFILGSGLAALSGSIWTLIAARIVQGAGGAVMTPASFSLIQAFLPEGPTRHRALGVFSLTQALALAIGPVLGGILTTSIGWRAVFIVNLPILAASLLLTILFVPRGASGAARNALDDIGGAVLLAIATGLLLAALSKLGEHGFTSRVGLALLSAALLAYFALSVLETRHRSPLIPMRLLRDRNLIGGALATLGLVAGFGSVLVLLSIYLQNGLHFSAAGAGLRMLPVAVAGLVLAPCAPVFMKRWSLRTLAIGGLAVEFMTLLLLTLSASTGLYLTVVAPLVFLSMLGNGIAFLALLGSSVADVSIDDQGAATGLIFTGQHIAVPAGVVITLAVLQAFPAIGTDGSLAAYSRAFLVPALAVGLGLVAVTVLTRTALGSR